MTREKGRELVDAFLKQAKLDDDKYLIVHFSRGEDSYRAMQDLDMFDGLIIIQQLIKSLQIDKAVLVSQLLEEVKSENHVDDIVH